MMYNCPQCGEETETLHEGYCEPCRQQNQLELDSHNAEYDRWEKLTDAQREDEIRSKGMSDTWGKPVDWKARSEGQHQRIMRMGAKMADMDEKLAELNRENAELRMSDGSGCEHADFIKSFRVPTSRECEQCGKLELDCLKVKVAALESDKKGLLALIASLQDRIAEAEDQGE